MSTQVFFNRPARPIDLQPLWNDMHATRHHLVLASAWFTDTELAGKFINAPAKRKTIVLNAADIDRGSKKAVEDIKSYFANPTRRTNIEDTSIFIATPRPDDYGLNVAGHRKVYGYVGEGVNTHYCVGGGDDIDAPALTFAVLGSGNWTEGVMHHKFILCDSVVWVGSYNLTYQARKNYETLIRIDDTAIAWEFYNEIEALIWEPALFTSSGEQINNAFKCSECSKLFPLTEMAGEHHGTYGEHATWCKPCYARLEPNQ